MQKVVFYCPTATVRGCHTVPSDSFFMPILYIWGDIHRALIFLGGFKLSSSANLLRGLQFVSVVFLIGNSGGWEKSLLNWMMQDNQIV